jgi:enterochelin esterase-like enzyme
MRTVLVFLASLLLVTQTQAQNPARTNASSRGSSSAIVSPEVHRDRTVTFRLRAPDATTVKVGGEWPGGATKLTNNNGVWSATVGPLEPDLYGYSFTVDNGLSLVDPANPWVKPMRASRTSVLLVPGDPPRVWEFQSVPHGTVHTHHYFSKAVDAKRRLHVYTPSGYEKSSEKYPVLYLFHGAGDNDATWTSLGQAHFISDNLLAQHQTKPMIIVMTDGHPTTENPTRITSNMMARSFELFREDVLRDVMPLVDASYRVKEGRENRAIIGLSMGGWQSLTIGLKERQLFAWVGGMSSFLPNAKELVAEAFPEPKSDLKLLWFACGKEDRLIESARQLSAALKEKQIAHEFKETSGDHSWPVWRRYLAEFMPLLFENAQTAAKR